MADAEDVGKEESAASDPHSETQDERKHQEFNEEGTAVTEEVKSHDLLSEAFSKMDDSGQEDDMNFTAAAGEINETNNAAAGSGALDGEDKQDSTSRNVIPEAEVEDGEAHSFSVVDDQDQILMAESTASSTNGLIDESVEESQTECLPGQIESSKMDTGSPTDTLSLSVSTESTMPSTNVLSDIAASSLLGSIATMIDSGSDCSLTDNTKGKDGLSILETAAATVGATPTGIALTTAPSPAAHPIALNLARSVQNTPLLVNGNSLLTGSSNIGSLGLGTSLLNTPGLVQAISQQQTAPITSVPTLRVAPSTPSPVTITVRTPPGTGALSQALISNIVNTPEVQALLAKNPGQPITIVRVPDAPAAPTAPVSAAVTNQISTPSPAPPPAPAPVSAAILTPSQTTTIPVMKTVTNVINKPQTPVRTFPSGTVLSNRLFNNTSNPSPIKTTTQPPSAALVKPSTSPKPAIVLGVKKKVGRGGGKAVAKGMAPAVPSSQDFNLMRQKRPANCKTRSGRVSRPPLYRIKEYKTMSNEEMGEQPGSSDGEYSDYDEHEAGSLALSLYNQKRKYKCQNCEKRYIGKGGLARHYRENRDHGDPDSVFTLKIEEQDEDQPMDDERQSDEKEKLEEKTSNEAAEKSNGDQSPKVEDVVEKPSPSKETSKEDDKVVQGTPKPAIITYHYTPRTGPYKPRGRGRGRGRPPGPSYKGLVDQSGDAGRATTSNSKDVPKADTSASSKFFDPKSPLDDDLIKVTLPMLCKIITPWEYTLASAQQRSITTKDATIFPTILKSLKEMQAEAKEMAASCLECITESDAAKELPSKESGTQEILIEDQTMATVLGVETGRYRFKDPAEDTLPKTVRLLRKQDAIKREQEQKQPKVVDKVGEALQRKRRMDSPAKSEPPIKKSPGTISILSPSKSASSRLASSSNSSPGKRIHTIGTIASIADVPLSSTVVKPAGKRPIPPLGPISSTSKGFESKKTAFEPSPPAKTTGVTTSLPPLKPIKTKPTTTKSASSSAQRQVSNTTTTSSSSSRLNTTLEEGDGAKESPVSTLSTGEQLMTSGLDALATTSDAGDVAKTQDPADTSSETLMETGEATTASEDLVEQTTVLPEGTTIMQLEDGTFLLQKPDGTAMQIQTPEGMTIETVQALLSMEGGAIETVEEPSQDPSPQYILDDGSCVQLPAGMSLDMAVEMGLINQSSE